VKKIFKVCVDLILERSRGQSAPNPSHEAHNQRNHDQDDHDDGGFGDDGSYAYEGLSLGTLKLTLELKDIPTCF